MKAWGPQLGGVKKREEAHAEALAEPIDIDKAKEHKSQADEAEVR